MNKRKANNKRTSGKSRRKVTRRSYTPIALVATLGQELVNTVMTAIDEAVDSFLTQALQMEPSQVGSRLKAEAAGYL